MAFVLLISLISVNIILVIITSVRMGFALDAWVGVLKVLPLLWVVVVAAVLLTRKPVMWLMSFIVAKGDSYRAHIFADTICSVFLISVTLTLVGPWIGTWHVSTDSVTHFFENWPRNFMIAFVVETLLGQPVARLVMRGHHHRTVQRSAKVPQMA